MQKVHLISFATSNFKRSKTRFLRQAMETQWYESVVAYDEVALRSLITEGFDRFVEGKGCGFWKWKPVIIYHRLLDLDDGDILQYCDVGCYLRKEGNARFMEYLNFMLEHDGLFFEACPSKLSGSLVDSRTFFLGTEEIWTKEYVFRFFEIPNNNLIRTSPGYGATTFFVKKNQKTLDFFKEMSELARKQPELFDDELMGYHNDKLISHRHDQSVMSIKLKKSSDLELYVLSGFENWYPSKDGTHADWGKLKKSPIWFKRDRSNTLFGVLQQKFMAVPRILIRKIKKLNATK